MPKEEDDKQITASGLDVLSTSCLIFHSAKGMGGNGAEEGGSKTDVWLCGTRFIVLYDKTFPLRYPVQVPQGGAISTLRLKHCLLFWLRYHFAVMFALRTV